MIISRLLDMFNRPVVNPMVPPKQTSIVDNLEHSTMHFITVIIYPITVVIGNRNMKLLNFTRECPKTQIERFRHPKEGCLPSKVIFRSISKCQSAVSSNQNVSFS